MCHYSIRCFYHWYYERALCVFDMLAAHNKVLNAYCGCCFLFVCFFVVLFTMPTQFNHKSKYLCCECVSIAWAKFFLPHPLIFVSFRIYFVRHNVRRQPEIFSNFCQQAWRGAFRVHYVWVHGRNSFWNRIKPLLQLKVGCSNSCDIIMLFDMSLIRSI